MCTECLPSGESDSLRPPPAEAPPRPPLPPRPPPPPPAVALPPAVHLLPWTSQANRLPTALKETDLPSAEGSISVNGRRVPSKTAPEAADNAAASRAWSNAGARVPLAGSAITNSLPSRVVTRYQSRSLASQLGRTPARTISGAVL